MSGRVWLLLAGALCGPRVALELLERAERRAELGVDDQAELWPWWWWLVPVLCGPRVWWALLDDAERRRRAR